MTTKICFRCGKEQTLSEFYKHPRMLDGHLNKCKTCTKKDSKKTETALRSTPEGLEKERARHREKYHRLEYLEKHKPSPEEKKAIMEQYFRRYPEKRLATTHSRRIKKQGFENHHWSYNEPHWKDVINLTTKDHNTAHRFMIYDQERKMYRTLEGVLLDTREAHENYVNEIIEKAKVNEKQNQRVPVPAQNRTLKAVPGRQAQKTH